MLNHIIIYIFQKSIQVSFFQRVDDNTNLQRVDNNTDLKDNTAICKKYMQKIDNFFF